MHMDEILRLSATQIAKHIRAGDLTAVQVTEAYLARLEAVNPIINAVTAVAPEPDAARKRSPGPTGGTMGSPRIVTSIPRWPRRMAKSCMISPDRPAPVRKTRRAVCSSWASAVKLSRATASSSALLPARMVLNVVSMVAAIASAFAAAASSVNG